MAVRTTSVLVQGVLVNDYGLDKDGNYPSLTPYIEAASSIVDDVESCAGDADMGTAMSAAKLELIERWLSAHCYCLMDQTYASKSDGASASFHGQTGMYFESTRYGQMALNLDYSGCLMMIGKRQFARALWLGKAPSTQISYDDRS